MAFEQIKTTTTTPVLAFLDFSKNFIVEDNTQTTV